MTRLLPPRLGMLLVALLALTACADDPTSDDSATTASPPSGGVATVDAEPQEVVPEADWTLGTIEIAFPDALTSLGGAVYVKTDDGHVVRVDPASGEVAADVRVDTTSSDDHYCVGIGSDGDTLWACSAGDRATDLVRLDPRTLEVLDTVEVDKVFDQLTLPVVDGVVWVLTADGNELTRLDAATLETTTTALDRRCLQLAASPTTVYATCAQTDELVAVDAATGEVATTVEVPSPVNVAVGAGSVWVSGADGLLRLSPQLEPQTLYEGLVVGQEGDVLATDDSVWVRQPAGFLYRIDPATDTVTTQYDLDTAVSGGSVLETDDGLWVTAFDDDLLFRIDPDG